MSQVLFIGDGKYLTVDRSWRDNGSDAQYALIGGKKVLVAEGTRAFPEIFQRGAGFYYKDGTPVTEIAHVQYLPEKYRKLAEQFITGDKPQTPLVPVATKAEAVAQVVKRGRGRPSKKAAASKTKKIEITDEESLRSVIAGGLPSEDEDE